MLFGKRCAAHCRQPYAADEQRSQQLGHGGPINSTRQLYDQDLPFVEQAFEIESHRAMSDDSPEVAIL
jgi:hypothetical protein